MSRYRIGSRVRQWLQWCLGILSLEKASQRRHEEQDEWHAGIMVQLDTISERLGRLENVFADQHVAQRRRPQAVSYDWDQVQLQALALMDKPEDS